MNYKLKYDDLVAKNLLLTKKNEDLLKEQEIKLSDYMNSYYHMYKMVELIYDDNGKVVDYCFKNVSETFLKYLHLTKDEIINKKGSEIHGTIETYWLETYEEVVKTGKSAIYENYNTDKKKFYELYAWKVSEKEVAVLFNDITARKKDFLDAKDTTNEIVALNISKDKLLSVIAHDLRSPFNVILGYSKLLIENATDKENVEDTLKYSSVLYSKAKETLVLLDNLLEWGNSQNGYINFRPEKTLISTIIRETIQNLLPTATIKDISINYISDVPYHVVSDVVMLKSILRNLISNAIKYTHLKGEITITVSQITDYCQVMVSDNGIGIDLSIQSNLFNSNTNVTTKGTEGERGAGLGLLICKEFVKKNDGEIKVVSTPGKGSDFVFTLPLGL